MSVGRSKGIGTRQTAPKGAPVEVRVQSPRLARLLAGELRIEDLDDEELARGMPRDKGGKFRGRPPLAIPRELHDRMVAELLKRGNALFREEFISAVKVFAEIAKDTEEDANVRLKAAQYVIERIAGKVPDKVEVRATDPWQQIIDDILVLDPEETKPTRKK